MVELDRWESYAPICFLRDIFFVGVGNKIRTIGKLLKYNPISCWGTIEDHQGNTINIDASYIPIESLEMLKFYQWIGFLKKNNEKEDLDIDLLEKIESKKQEFLKTVSLE